MRIPFKPSMMEIRRGKPQWLILHHTSELYENPIARIDNQKYQMKGLYNGVLERKEGDVNYNYVIEKIDEDYHAITCRPFSFICDYPDIDPSINNKAIHIALLGNYDFKIPEKRLYEVLAYRVLNPLLKMFQLNPGKIKFHNELSKMDDLTCPGEFLEMEIVQAMVRKFVIK